MSERLQLLIVDDDPAVVRALRRVLRVAYDVDGCTSPDDVVERLRTGARYDVLFVDYRFADRTAQALVDDVARLSPEQASRIVIVTGDEAPRVRALGRDLPTLRKPVGTRDLERMVATVAKARAA